MSPGGFSRQVATAPDGVALEIEGWRPGGLAVLIEDGVTIGDAFSSMEAAREAADTRYHLRGKANGAGTERIIWRTE